MARQFLTAIDLTKNEIQNAVAQNLAGAPAAPVKGQFYFNSTDNVLYWWNGTAWIPAQDSGASGFPGYGASVVAETAFGQTSAVGVATTVARADHTHGSPTHDAAAHAGIPINSFATATGPIDMGGFTITGVGTPVNPTDAANKGYVDNAIAGLSWKQNVRLASNGTSYSLTGAASIDGVAAVTGDRILLKDQVPGSANGIYIANTAGAWTRATDADTGSELVNAAVFVSLGGANGDKAFVCTNDAPITIGTTNTAWVQFAGGGAVTAGAGMTQSGNTLNIVGSGGIAVSPDSIAVDYPSLDTRYTQKTSMACEAGLTTTINHTYGRNVLVEVFRNSAPWDTVDVDVERPTTGSTLIRFAQPVAAGQYMLVVHG